MKHTIRAKSPAKQARQARPASLAKPAKLAKALATTSLAFLLALSTVALGGCLGPTGSRDINLTPTISSPVIGLDGVLRVGIDSGKVPYAGVDTKGNIVGIDVDVAAAIAQELGLKLEIVDTAGRSAEAMLSEGAVDMVMDIEQTGGSIIRGTQVGPYIESGPALFAIVISDTTPTIDLPSLAGTPIAAQKDSMSSWSVDEIIGAGTADPRENLEDAFSALERGEVSYAAADAVVGSYLALEFTNISCVKMLGNPIGVYIGVSAENTQLAEALTQALRTVRDQGILETIFAKWLGPVSASVVMGTSAITSQETAVTPDGEPGFIDLGEDLPDPENAG